MPDSSGEKTEQPTQKRLRDARKKGQVAKSQDLSSALMLITSVCILWLLSGYLGEMFLSEVRSQLTYAVTFNESFNEKVALTALFGGVKLLAIATVPILGAMFIVAFAVNFLQIGALFSFEAVSPNFSKLNPVEGFKQKFFKMKSYIELGKTVLKIIITAAVVYYVLAASVGDIVKLTYQPLPVALSFVFVLMMQIFLTVGIAFLIIGAGDFFLQQFLHKKELMMTKQEVKEEWKEMEGDPYIKSKRKQIHREIISQAMAAKVKAANVVVANPTHLAIALSYEQGSAGAPVVVAKGADYMALQIRSIAEEAGVPITRDVPLARSLYKLEIDDEIPEELYEAVAIVLRWVYDMAEEKA